MKESDKNEVKLIVIEEVDKGVNDAKEFTKDQRNLVYKIIGLGIPIMTLIFGFIAFLGLDYYLTDTIKKKIGDEALQEYRNRIERATKNAEKDASDLSIIFEKSKESVKELEKNLKKYSAFGVVGRPMDVSNGEEIKIETPGWVYVPWLNAIHGATIDNIPVKSNNESYLVVYSYRVELTEAGESKSAVFVFHGDEVIREYTRDESSIKDGKTNQYSVAFIVRGLKPGSYTFALKDYCNNNKSRKFGGSKQFIVYRLS